MLIGQMTGAQVECVELVDIGALIAKKSEQKLAILISKYVWTACLIFIIDSVSVVGELEFIKCDVVEVVPGVTRGRVVVVLVELGHMRHGIMVTMVSSHYPL